MSISVLSKVNGNCDAIITWLFQLFVLDDFPSMFCVNEMVIKCTSGKLKQLNVHVPYKVANMENRCFSLLKDLNKYYYAEDSYELLEKDRNRQDHGLIKFDNEETKVSGIQLKPIETAIGTNIKILFDKPLIENERRAIRITYDCKDVLIKNPNDEIALELHYLSSQPALLLSLEETLKIEKIFIWLVFPPNLKKIIKTIPEFWQQRPLTKIRNDLMELFYGERTESIWSKLPRTVGMWERGRLEPDKELSKEKWPRIYYYSEYELLKDEKVSFARLFDNNNLPDGIEITKAQFDDIFSKEDYYDIIIDDLNEKIYFEGNEVMKKQIKTKKFLSYLLRNYRELCLYENIEKDVFKFEMKDYNSIKQHKYKILNAIPKLKNHIISISGEGYKFIGDISFCIISLD